MRGAEGGTGRKGPRSTRALKDSLVALRREKRGEYGKESFDWKTRRTVAGPDTECRRNNKDY